MRTNRTPAPHWQWHPQSGQSFFMLCFTGQDDFPAVAPFDELVQGSNRRTMQTLPHLFRIGIDRSQFIPASKWFKAVIVSPFSITQEDSRPHSDQFKFLKIAQMRQKGVHEIGTHSVQFINWNLHIIRQGRQKRRLITIKTRFYIGPGFLLFLKGKRDGVFSWIIAFISAATSARS